MSEDYDPYEEFYNSSEGLDERQRRSERQRGKHPLAGLDYATERARVETERLAAARKAWGRLKAAAEQPEEAML